MRFKEKKGIIRTPEAYFIGLTGKQGHFLSLLKYEIPENQLKKIENLKFLRKNAPGKEERRKINALLAQVCRENDAGMEAFYAQKVPEISKKMGFSVKIIKKIGGFKHEIRNNSGNRSVLSHKKQNNIGKERTNQGYNRK